MVQLALIAAWASAVRAAGGVWHGLLSSVSISLLTSVSVSARSRDGLYEPALADSEREAVADLLQYLENVSRQALDQLDGS